LRSINVKNFGADIVNPMAAGLQTGHARVQLCFLFKEYIMNSFMQAARNFARDEDGITAIEYGLIAAVMAAAVAAAFGPLSEALGSAFAAIAAALNPAAPAP
jgi:pilus assembly protein Flp/PilA